MTAPWWRDAVFYEIYVRSFADGNGDGVGDLAGIRSRLPYLRDLGVDALWLTPFYPSPGADHGYDVADPRDVDPLFGDLAELDALVADAHDLGLRVTVDVVPNHTSDQRDWFRQALAAGPGSPERDRYIFRRGRGRDGAQPPNNWESVFGGPAWERVEDGEWYLHLFAKEQPDLNWRNNEVVEDAEQTLRFWLDRGVDGFRIDVAHGLLKDKRLRDNPAARDLELFGHGDEEVHSWNQPEVHEIFRRWRRILDSYDGDRMAVGEVWVRSDEDLALYVRPNELHLAFNFRFLMAPWNAAELRDAVDRSVRATAGVGTRPTWVIDSHDARRSTSRYGSFARSYAAALLMLALPGAAYVYQGQELGLPEVELPPELIQDPQWHRSGGTKVTRDGCRVPLPWSGDVPPFGFSPPGTATWLPQPADWSTLTVAAQTGDDRSILALYRAALRLRRELPALGDGTMQWLPSPAKSLVFRRDPGFVCAVNAGSRPHKLPAGTVVLASGPLDGDRLPPDTAVWLVED